MARKQKNPYLGPMDKGLQIFQKIVHAVIDAGGDENDFERFLTGKTDDATIAGAFMAWRNKKVLAVQSSYLDQIKSWESFYLKHFSITVNLNAVLIPPTPTDGRKYRLIFMAPGISSQKVYDACAKRFKCWKYTDADLDKVITKNDRDPNIHGTYAIWVLDEVEADESNKNKSANDCATQGIKGQTFMERGIQELDYFDETGNHLDFSNWTLCSGSRDSDGSVPYVSWDGDDEMDVYDASADDRDDYLRARSVVSLVP